MNPNYAKAKASQRRHFINRKCNLRKRMRYKLLSPARTTLIFFKSTNQQPIKYFSFSFVCISRESNLMFNFKKSKRMKSREKNWESYEKRIMVKIKDVFASTQVKGIFEVLTLVMVVVVFFKAFFFM